MSIEPIRSPAERAPRHQRSAKLREALAAEAAALAELQESEQLVARTVDEDTRQCEYTWQTPEDRDASFRIDYKADEDVEILGVELIEIDYRKPTPQERL